MKRNVDCDTAFRTGLSARVSHSGNKSGQELLFYPDLKFYYHVTRTAPRALSLQNY